MKFRIALPDGSRVGRPAGEHCEAPHSCGSCREEGPGSSFFPELSLTGYSIKDLNWDLAINVPRRTAACSVAPEEQVHCHPCGGVEESKKFRSTIPHSIVRTGRSGPSTEKLIRRRTACSRRTATSAAGRAYARSTPVWTAWRADLRRSVHSRCPICWRRMVRMRFLPCGESNAHQRGPSFPLRR